MRKNWWAAFAIGGLVVAAVVFYQFWQGRADRAVHASGTVEGLEVQITTKIPGRIAKLCCREGETVKAGDLVLQLESEELKTAVEQAMAGVDKARAEQLVARAGIAAAKARLASAAADIITAEAEVRRSLAQEEDASRTRDRYAALYGKNAVAKAAYDDAVTAFATAAADAGAARARVEAMRAQRDSAAAQLAAAENQLLMAAASLNQAEANRRYAEAKLDDTVIRSPMDGMVAFRALEEGETVAPAVTVLTLVDQRHLFIRVDLDESRVGRIGVGDAATIIVESLPDRIFRGTVAEISRYGEFATQRDVVRGRQDLRTFKVRIQLMEHGGHLKPGMTVEVVIPVRGADGRPIG